MSNASSASQSFSHSDIMRVMSGAMLCVLLAALDQTVVIPALPAIASDLGAYKQLSWIVAAYLITSTISTPVYGKLTATPTSCCWKAIPRLSGWRTPTRPKRRDARAAPYRALWVLPRRGGRSGYPFAHTYRSLDGRAFTRRQVFNHFATSLTNGVISSIKWGYPKSPRVCGASDLRERPLAGRTCLMSSV
jgi:hypothetical protein